MSDDEKPARDYESDIYVRDAELSRLRAELATMKHKADDRLGCMLEATKRASKAEAELAAERVRVVEECAEIVEDLTMQSGMCDGVTAVKRIRAVLSETKGDGDE